jgi:hypothetical protein
MDRMTGVPPTVRIGPVIRTVRNRHGVTVQIRTVLPQIRVVLLRPVLPIIIRPVIGAVLPATTITTAGVIPTIAEVILVTTVVAVETAGKRQHRPMFVSQFSRRMPGCRVINPTGVLTADVTAGASAKKIDVC